MKKAQLLQQPIFMIFTLVVTFAILIYGIFVISNVIKTGKQVELADFKNTLQKEINTYYILDPGSSKTLTLATSKDINYICFTDFNSEIDETKIPNNQETLILNKPNNNLFFIPYPNKAIPNPETLQKFKPITNPLCKETNGRLIIKLTSQGTYVEIS